MIEAAVERQQRNMARNQERESNEENQVSDQGSKSGEVLGEDQISLHLNNAKDDNAEDDGNQAQGASSDVEIVNGYDIPDDASNASNTGAIIISDFSPENARGISNAGHEKLVYEGYKAELKLMTLISFGQAYLRIADRLPGETIRKLMKPRNPRVQNAIIAGHIRQEAARLYLIHKQQIKCEVYKEIDFDMSASDSDFESEDKQLYDSNLLSINPWVLRLCKKYKIFGQAKAKLVLKQRLARTGITLNTK